METTKAVGQFLSHSLSGLLGSGIYLIASKNIYTTKNFLAILALGQVASYVGTEIAQMYWEGAAVRIIAVACGIFGPFILIGLLAIAEKFAKEPVKTMKDLAEFVKLWKK